MAGGPGKRGRAVNLNANLTAPMQSSDEIKRQSNKANPDTVPIVVPEMQIVNLYTVGHKPRKNDNQTTKLFIHHLHRYNMNAIRVQATFDDGALVDVMSTTKFNQVK